MRIELTGSLRIVGSGGRAIEAGAFPGRQGRVLFARLATSSGPVTREQLADELWPNGPPDNWKRDLSVLVSKLRTLLRDAGIDDRGCLVLADGCYRMRFPTDVVIDVDEAEALTDTACRRLDDHEPGGALEAARRAIEVARRPFLAGEDADWITQRRRGLEEMLLRSLDIAATVLGEQGDVSGAIAMGRQAVERAPFREHGYTQLMRLQLAAGDRAEALRTYARCRELLADELGVDPAPETEAVYLHALKAGRQGSDEITAETRAGTAPPAGFGNLPAPTSSFVGRDRDISRIETTLSTARMVTLTGVGGVGKSRLAVEFASRAAGMFRDGTWLCELAHVADEERIVYAVAGTLGITHGPEVSIEDSIVGYLRPRRLLLVVDNCEHVLGAVARLLDTVLLYCPHVRVVATSRVPLATDGEHLLTIEPLELPAPGTDALASLLTPASVRLFCDRASAATDAFGLTPSNAGAIADVCRKLDGVPLAIELAAARLRTLSAEELVERLDERFRLLTGGPANRAPRQRTLEATVTWSYEPLPADDRAVFDRLSVFAGRFTAAAARAVCADLGLGTSVDRILNELVNRSMLMSYSHGGVTRYWLLETLRAYGRDRLAERDGVTAARGRHAAYYVALAKATAERLHGPDEASAATVLNSHLPELRLVHRWALETGDVDLAVRLSAALNWFVTFHAHTEVAMWALETVQLRGADQRPHFARACHAAGTGCWMRGERQQAEELARLGLTVAGAHPSRRFAQHILGDTALLNGNLDEALHRYRDALAGARASEDGFHETILAGCLALVLSYLGDSDEASLAASETRRLARQLINPSATAWALHVSGEAQTPTDPEGALALFDDSIELARSVGNTFVLGLSLLSASSVRMRHGDSDDALRTFIEVIGHWYDLGNWTQQWTTLRNVVDVLVRLGIETAAAVLLGAVRIPERGAPPFGADARRLDQAQRMLEDRLGRAAVASAIARGEAMDADNVVAYVRAELQQARDLTRGRASGRVARSDGSSATEVNPPRVPR